MEPFFGIVGLKTASEVKEVCKTFESPAFKKTGFTPYLLFDYDEAEMRSEKAFIPLKNTLTFVRRSFPSVLPGIRYINRNSGADFSSTYFKQIISTLLHPSIFQYSYICPSKDMVRSCLDDFPNCLFSLQVPPSKVLTSLVQAYLKDSPFAFHMFDVDLHSSEESVAFLEELSSHRSYGISTRIETELSKEYKELFLQSSFKPHLEFRVAKEDNGSFENNIPLAIKTIESFL